MAYRELLAVAGLMALMAANVDVPARTTAHLKLRGRDQELHLYGVRGRASVILSSGDLGWSGLVEHVAEFLAANGYYVTGFNSKAYLSSFTSGKETLSPHDVPGDFGCLVEFARTGSPGRPVLAGISEGAGLSVLAATAPEIQERVQGVLGLGLPDQNELGWRWQDFTIWITKKSPNEPSFMVEDIISRVSPVPLAEIHSTHDEFVSLDQARMMLSRAGDPKRMWIVEAANHRFSDNHGKLDASILEALRWIKAIRESKSDRD